MANPENVPAPLSPEQELALFSKNIERMTTPEEIAQCVATIILAQDYGNTDLQAQKISLGNKAGIRRFTRVAYFTALVHALDDDQRLAQQFMMSPEEAREQGIND